jgi:glycosyltransferase involved in cell wall biosynthesis
MLRKKPRPRNDARHIGPELESGPPLDYKGPVPAVHMKLAYLVNQYPRVSHTFIRREIAALEDAGLEVARFSIRQSPEEVVDPADRAELQRTRVIVAVGIHGLLMALAWRLLRSPSALVRAALVTLRIGWSSDRGLLRHVAYLAEACVLLRWFRATGITHVHAHFGTNSAAVVMLCRELGGPPYSFTIHGPEEFDKPLSISLRTKIEHASFVVAISSYCRSQIFRYCGHEHWSRVHVVHCALDQEFLGAPPEPIPAAPRIVTVGRLNEQKGQLLLVEAVARLASRGVDFELVLVGDGEMRAELDAMIAREGLGTRVKITGWAPNAEVRAQLVAARFMILPSFAEGLPVVIMEALALGRPVLATYVAGIPELVGEDCGWLIPPGSVDAIAEGIERALALDDAQLQALGRAGRAKVRKEHDAAVEAAKLLELFKRYAAR